LANILHIETATQTCSAALSAAGELVSFKESHIDKSHASLLTVYIKEMFTETGRSPSDLEAVAVSMGPGSYTGLRIGVSVAKGLAYSLNIPVIGVSTLKAMAYASLQRKETDDRPFLLCPMIDARRMEVYLSLFDNKLNTIRDTGAVIIDETSFKKELEKKRIYFFGSGSAKYKDLTDHKNAVFIDDFQNSSKDMILLAYEQFRKKNFVDTAYFEPYYLKDFVATTPKNKILGSL